MRMRDRVRETERASLLRGPRSAHPPPHRLRPAAQYQLLRARTAASLRLLQVSLRLAAAPRTVRIAPASLPHPHRSTRTHRRTDARSLPRLPPPASRAPVPLPGTRTPGAGPHPRAPARPLRSPAHAMGDPRNHSRRSRGTPARSGRQPGGWLSPRQTGRGRGLLHLCRCRHRRPFAAATGNAAGAWPDRSHRSRCTSGQRCLPRLSGRSQRIPVRHVQRLDLSPGRSPRPRPH